MTLEVKTNNTTLLAVAFLFWQAWNLLQQLRLILMIARIGRLGMHWLIVMASWVMLACNFMDRQLNYDSRREIYIQKMIDRVQLLPMIWNFTVHGTAVHDFVLQSYLHKQFTRIVLTYSSITPTILWL